MFIALDDFVNGKAVHKLLEPDSALGSETWEILCEKHKDYHVCERNMNGGCEVPGCPEPACL